MFIPSIGEPVEETKKIKNSCNVTAAPGNPVGRINTDNLQWQKLMC